MPVCQVSFRTDLNRGELGEAIFYQAHGGTLTRSDGREGDFVNVASGEKVELKTDFYSMADTPNMFIETYSNKEKGTPGGPFQSLLHGASVFVYFYVKDLTFYKFNTQELVDSLGEITKDLKPTRVKNSNSEGYRVPRDLLKSICSEHVIKVSIEDKS